MRYDQTILLSTTAHLNLVKAFQWNRSHKEYCGTQLYGHPLNSDTSLLWAFIFVPAESPHILSKFNLVYTNTH